MTTEAKSACADCGTELAPTTRFCPECGRATEAVAPAAEPADTRGSAQDSARPRRIGKPVAIGVGIIIVLVGVGIALVLQRGGGGSSTHTVTGTVTLREGQNLYTPGSPCVAQASFGDVAAGAEVHILDGSGATIGVGALAAGQHQGADVQGDSGRCGFSFTIDAVPDEAVYSVTIAGRQGPSYSKTELANDGWNIDLTR